MNEEIYEIEKQRLLDEAKIAYAEEVWQNKQTNKKILPNLKAAVFQSFA